MMEVTVLLMSLTALMCAVFILSIAHSLQQIVPLLAGMAESQKHMVTASRAVLVLVDQQIKTTQQQVRSTEALTGVLNHRTRMVVPFGGSQN
jgi:hypothetical protein